MKFCPYFSQRLVNLLNLVHGKSEHWKQCVILFPSNINGMFYIFTARTILFCSFAGTFSLVYMGQPPQKTPQAGIRPLYDFIQPAFSPSKIGEIKLVGFAFLFHFYYIASFLKEWTGCQAYF